jgi:hypothetical protein
VSEEAQAARVAELLSRESEFMPEDKPYVQIGSRWFKRVRRRSWSLSVGGRYPVHVALLSRTMLLGVQWTKHSLRLSLGPLSVEFLR